jgi:hypothetical protein
MELAMTTPSAANARAASATAAASRVDGEAAFDASIRSAWSAR